MPHMMSIIPVPLVSPRTTTKWKFSYASQPSMFKHTMKLFRSEQAPQPYEHCNLGCVTPDYYNSKGNKGRRKNSEKNNNKRKEKV